MGLEVPTCDHAVNTVRVERDGDVVAKGAVLPFSGDVIIEWDRTAFPPGERTNKPTTSRYQNVTDASQATGGEVVVEAGGQR